MVFCEHVSRAGQDIVCRFPSPIFGFIVAFPVYVVVDFLRGISVALLGAMMRTYAFEEFVFLDSLNFESTSQVSAVRKVFGVV